jgi:hypothetical protein
VCPDAVPLLGAEALQQLEARLADRQHHRKRRGDRPVVVEASGESALVVAHDDRIVLGDEAAEADKGGGLAVGEVMDHHARGPLSGCGTAVRSDLEPGYGRDS